MTVLETLQQMSDRLQVAIIVGSIPTDGSGDIRVIHANAPAAVMFGFFNPKDMNGIDVRSLMPSDIARSHKSMVANYLESRTHRPSSIMGAWRDLDGVKKDGSVVPVSANVARVQNSEEQYFVAVFRDRTDDVRKESELSAAVAESKRMTELAHAAKSQAEDALKKAEDSLLKEKRLMGQIATLRMVFAGVVSLVVLLAVLIIVQWATGAQSGEGISMVKDILLVLTGILGSAMASVFDSRNSQSRGSD